MAEDRWERWSALTGIVFVALFVALGFVGGETPENADAQELVAFYQDQGEVGVGLQYFLVGLGAAAFLWFVGTLRSVLRRAEGEPGRLSAVAFGGGVASAVLVLMAGSAFIAPAATVVFEEDPVALTPILDAVIGSTGFIALNFAIIASAVMFTATGVVALRTRVLPAWYAWVGFVISLGLVVNIFYFFGFFAWLAWVLVTSVILLMPRATTTRRR
ncbi:MAG TPA: hypothetical protein VG602_00455 [Actinomycetota bacterium]|nr:hypothetical protein [Actinomycetota bacterium]